MLNQCEKCWQTICICGWEYKDWTRAALQKQITMLQKVLENKIKNKKALSYFNLQDIITKIAQEDISVDLKKDIITSFTVEPAGQNRKGYQLIGHGTYKPERGPLGG
jgi:hypothetical protein